MNNEEQQNKLMAELRAQRDEARRLRDARILEAESENYQLCAEVERLKAERAAMEQSRNTYAERDALASKLESAHAALTEIAAEECTMNPKAARLKRLATTALLSLEQPASEAQPKGNNPQ